MGSKFRTFSQNFKVVSMGTPATWSAAAQYAVSTWIDFRTYRRAIFLPHAGELDADMTVSVYEADDAAGANAQEVSAALVGTFTNGVDEGLPGIIEILDSDLEKPFLNLLVTPGATDGFSGVLLLDEGHEQPEVNTINTDIAFNERTT
ncbi:MAG: hypothetical protein ACYTEQ_06555 [Planctomycetota bacterium]|jgi:hypothetical protein